MADQPGHGPSRRAVLAGGVVAATGGAVAGIAGCGATGGAASGTPDRAAFADSGVVGRATEPFHGERFLP